MRLLRPAARSHFWLWCVDFCPAVAAAFLPWSTSAVSIFMGVWFLFLIPTVNLRDFSQALKAPACALPLALFAVAIVGMSWGRWRLVHAIAWPSSGFEIFLVLPCLLYHYCRSQRGHWVFLAFLASCTLLTVVSWFAFFADWKLGSFTLGVPVKNYIDQSHEVTLCVLALAPYLLTSLTQRNWKHAILLCGLMLGISFQSDVRCIRPDGTFIHSSFSRSFRRVLIQARGA